LVLSLAALALAAPAAAQDRSDPHRRMLAAGYKAAFLCSGLFNAGQSEATVERDELKGTYPELEPIFPELKASVDREKLTVSVPFAPDLPPRVAIWRPHIGCTQLPVGADPDMQIFRMGGPALDYARLDARPWPMGDRGGTARFSGNARRLGQAIDRAFDRRSYGQGSETTAVLVLQDGRIVAERYRADFDRHTSQRTWSVAKSMAATLIGVAVQDKLLDVHRPLGVEAPYQPAGRSARPSRTGRGATRAGNSRSITCCACRAACPARMPATARTTFTSGALRSATRSAACRWSPSRERASATPITTRCLR
jgi:hypothetical protein